MVNHSVSDEIIFRGKYIDNGALADQVWELWNGGVITDDLAAWAWYAIST